MARKFQYPALFEGISDPAEVISIAFCNTVRGLFEDPPYHWLVQHSGLPYDRVRESFEESGVRDLDREIGEGRFALPNRRAAEGLLGGVMVAILSGRASGARIDADFDDTVKYALHHLGLPPDEAQEIAHIPLPSLPDDQ